MQPELLTNIDGDGHLPLGRDAHGDVPSVRILPLRVVPDCTGDTACSISPIAAYRFARRGLRSPLG
jgi:hypothetical protein